MILSFNPKIFASDEDYILKKLAQIFDLLTIDRKNIDLVDIDSFYSTVFDENGNYIFDDGDFSASSLSSIDRKRIEEFFMIFAQKGAYIDESRRKYLTTLNIGLEANEIHPELAHKILSNPSKIIVENATNDWKFLEGIINKYRNHNKRRSIYMLIKESLDSPFLLAEHAGGKGQIRARYEDLKTHQYKDIDRYKLMALFDSDRENNISLHHEVNSLINYFKGKVVNYTSAKYEKSDLIVWHMFYKRELENYVPIDVMTSLLPLTKDEADGLSAKNYDELDFLDYEDYLKNNSKITVKKDFPEIFLGEWTRDRIEYRCEPFTENIELANGTLENVSEIEKILLKIAEII